MNQLGRLQQPVDEDFVRRIDMKGTVVQAAMPALKTAVDEVMPVRAGYLAAILAGGLLALGGFFGLLLGFEKAGHLPPPPIANNICIDEKLAFLREHPPQKPNLLVIGSSIAWRHFDSASVIAAAPTIRPLNGAFCSLRINQSVFTANWLLDHLPSVREVLMIASPQDFQLCSAQPAAVFDRYNADRFVFGHDSKWVFYFRYFDPISLIRNVRRVAAMRANVHPLNSLVFTKFGDGPLDTTASMSTLQYGDLQGLDAACFGALRSLAEKLAADGRRIVVVTTPLNPEWKLRHDSDGQIRATLAKNIASSLAGTRGEHWDADAVIAMNPQAFVDAIHLRWSAAGEFSQKLARILRPVDLQ